MQFILQLKLCLYTTVHLLFEEFRNFSQVILEYTIMSHSKYHSRSRILAFFGPELESESKFLVPESKS